MAWLICHRKFILPAGKFYSVVNILANFLGFEKNGEWLVGRQWFGVFNCVGIPCGVSRKQTLK
jgi:hypothetical protein